MRPVFLVFTGASIFLAAQYMFGFGVFDWYVPEWGYYYLLIALLMPIVFLIFPARRKDTAKLPWYDLAAALLSFGIGFYFHLFALDFQPEAWAYDPSPLNLFLGGVLCLLCLESARRTGGLIFMAIAVILFFYPLVAEKLPGALKGFGFDHKMLIGMICFDGEGLLGLPMRVVGGLLIGFLVFAGILVATGAGQFFLNLALSVAGRFRGGPAKVAVLSSGLMGSMSGSVISNVVGTGSFTIPAMKRIGYPPHYAGGIEACASTGGVLMPPVMGAAGFVMAELLDIPYVRVMAAAFIPSILYYLGLLLQTDAYAARAGLKGMPKEDIPPVWQALKEGWHFLFALAFLIWGLLYMRWEALTPFYASALLLVLATLRKSTRFNFKGLVGILESVGKLLVETFGIIIPIGLIVAGLVQTGMAPALTAGIVALSGGIPFVALVLGAIVCYILGMVGLLTPAYLFLALTLAPSLVMVGFNVFAVHMFCIYYAMLACFTPPVAAGAFVGAAIAGAPPMKTAWQAVRLGIVIYFLPFFFVYQPALLFQNTNVVEFLWLFSTCALGVVFVAAGVEGYLIRAGTVPMWMRPFLVIGGILIAMPGWKTDIGGACVVVVIIVSMLTRRRRALATG